MLASDWNNRRPAYDFVVVGSGYGGAIAAARLATANLAPKPTICILERGKEWPVGSFPDTLEKYTLESRSPANPLGLYEALHYRDISIIKGSGLGGTSLINANIALIPDPDIFQLTEWPRSLTYESLLPYYQRARQTLGIVPHPRAAEMIKFQALDRSVRETGARAQPTDITVNFTVDGVNEYGVPAKPCIDCGDCVTGCNVGAKNTLAMNYLPIAKRGGAEIYTQVKVEWIEKRDGGWRIHGERVDSPLKKAKFQIYARNVILAAGSVNTTEILMRSEMHGLKVSPRLGTNFSGNGDFQAVAYNCDVPVQGLGFGNHPESDGAMLAPGPTNLGTVRRYLDRAPGERFLVQDFAIPSAFVRAAQVAMATFPARDLDRGDEAEEQQRKQEDLLQSRPFSPKGALFHSVILPASAMDDARGSMVFEAPWWEPDGRMHILWDDVGRQPRFRRLNTELLQMTRALGGTYFENAVWATLNLRRLLTFHPLGGCPIGEDYLHGAVDEFGRVFSGDGTVHEGLFVTDGALIPSALGVNPLLTISALAERIAERKVEQLQGREYPKPQLSVALSGLDPRDTLGVRDAELEKLFRRSATLGIETLLNKGEQRVDLEKRRIYNDTCWKGFMPKGVPLGELAQGLFTGYDKRFWKEGDQYLGETRYLDGRVPLHHRVEEINLEKRTGNLDPGRYFLLHFTDPAFRFVFYDVMKVISNDIILYRGHTGVYPNGIRGFTTCLLRSYGFEEMSADDHWRLYEAGRTPTAEELEGVWRMDAVASANHAAAVAYLRFDRKPDGRLESRYQFMGLFEGLVMPSFLTNHFQLHDFTPFHDEIRLLDKDYMIGRWVTDLPSGVAQLLPAGSLGLLHTIDAEDGRKQFGFFYTLSRVEAGEMPQNLLLQQFLDVYLPDGLGMTFDEEMEGWYLPDFVPEGSGRNADLAIADKAPAEGAPSGSMDCRFRLRLSIAELNEFLDGAEHEAAASGTIEFSQWQGSGAKSFRVDDRKSRFHYLRVNEASGEAEVVYHLEFDTPEGVRYLFDGRKYMQKDEGGGVRGMREVLEDYTTLYARLYRLQGESRQPSGAGLLKFKTFENAAAVRNLTDFLGSFRITGTSDLLLQAQARMRFLAFTARFVQFEYDPLSLDRGTLREDVAAAITRGAETPDYFSTRPTVELQSILRETETRPLESLLNEGGVRFDFEKRRIFRDSFWKGSFAEDTLLGWEEKIRTAALEVNAERMGALFAGGSFWKRFDKIENGVCRSTTVNYEVEWLPGDADVREVAYPNDSRRYFKKGDKILLLTYRNEPYRIVYDAIKVIDEENSIGVMHLGEFPNGFEFSTFAMARQNYPFEKMALEDHHALFAHERAARPSATAMAGEWTGHLVFLGRPNVSLLNAANPALLHVTFREAGHRIEGAFRFGPAGGELSPEFPIHKTMDQLQGELRMIDDRTMLGKWTMPDVTPGLFLTLRDFVETGKGRPAFYWVLTRQP